MANKIIFVMFVINHVRSGVSGLWQVWWNVWLQLYDTNAQKRLNETQGVTQERVITPN